MTAVPFFTFPVLTGDDNAARVSLGNISTFNGHIGTSFGHWLLGGTADSLDSIEPQNRSLTVQGGTPAYSGNYVSISGANGNALLTGVEDEGQSVTMWSVFRVPTGSTGLIPLFGSLDNSPATAGRSVYRNTSGEFSFRVFNQIVTGGPAMALDTWYFAAFSTNSSTGETLIMPGGVGAGGVLSKTATPIAPGFQFGVGNPAYEGVSGNTLNFAEAGIIRGHVSASDLHAIYLNSVTLMAARGITVTSF